MSTWFETQTQKDERPVRGQLQKGEVHENRREGGEFREQQRLGLSQGTMIWEPRYGGGAHPKYRSCRVLVSQIPRTEVWRGCTPEVLKLYGEGVPNQFPSHGLFGFVVHLLVEWRQQRIFAIFLRESIEPLSKNSCRTSYFLIFFFLIFKNSCRTS